MTRSTGCAGSCPPSTRPRGPHPSGSLRQRRHIVRVRGGRGAGGGPDGRRVDSTVLLHLPRHRRRRLHRLAPGRGAAGPRRPGHRARQPVDRAATRTWPRSSDHPDLTFVHGSVLDELQVDELVHECDVVVHLAAAVGVKLIVEQPLRSFTTNIRGSEIVIEAAYRYRRRILLASTSEIYGKNGAEPAAGGRRPHPRLARHRPLGLQHGQGGRRDPRLRLPPGAGPADDRRPPVQHRRPPPEPGLRHGHPPPGPPGGGRRAAHRLRRRHPDPVLLPRRRRGRRPARPARPPRRHRRGLQHRLARRRSRSSTWPTGSSRRRQHVRRSSSSPTRRPTTTASRTCAGGCPTPPSCASSPAGSPATPSTTSSRPPSPRPSAEQTGARVAWCPPGRSPSSPPSRLALVGTPVLRRLADRHRVRRPARRPARATAGPVPYLGGIAIITASSLALLFEARAAPRVARADGGRRRPGRHGPARRRPHRRPPLPVRWPRPGRGSLAVGGRRAHPRHRHRAASTSSSPIVWIVGVTNAINLLDNMDALAAGVSAVAALSVFALAILGRQPVVATLAAAVAGACLGLPRLQPAAGVDLHGRRRAACSSASSSPSSPSTSARPCSRRVSFVVPLLLLAIPVLDTTVVTLARLRRGRPVSQGGRDHLSHRLAKRGHAASGRRWRCSSAARACSGRWRCWPGGGSSPWASPCWSAVAILGVLLAVTARAEVYNEPVVGFPRSLKRAVVGRHPGHARAGRPRRASPWSSANGPRPGRGRRRQAGRRRPPGGRLRGQRRPVPRGQRPAGHGRRPARRARWCRSGLLVPGLSSNLHASRTLVSVGDRAGGGGDRPGRGGRRSTWPGTGGGRRPPRPPQAADPRARTGGRRRRARRGARWRDSR